MEKAHIILKGEPLSNIKLALQNLSNLYHKTDYSKGFQLYKHKTENNSFSLQFDNAPDFEHFSYFTNYINYPEGLDNVQIQVNGYWPINQKIENIEGEIGQWLMLYISPEDTEYDNVFVVNKNNKYYKYDFGGNVSQLPNEVRPFQKSIYDNTDYEHCLLINPSVQVKKKSWWKFWE